MLKIIHGLLEFSTASSPIQPAHRYAAAPLRSTNVINASTVKTFKTLAVPGPRSIHILPHFIPLRITMVRFRWRAIYSQVCIILNTPSSSQVSRIAKLLWGFLMFALSLTVDGFTIVQCRQVSQEHTPTCNLWHCIHNHRAQRVWIIEHQLDIWLRSEVRSLTVVNALPCIVESWSVCFVRW